MKISNLTLLAILTLPPIALACGDEDVNPPSGNTPGPLSPDPIESFLDGRSFQLDQAEGYAPVEGTTIRLSFSDGTFGMGAGCNAHGGDYQIDGDTLVITSMLSTDMGCGEPLARQEEWFRTFLRSRPTIGLDGDWLTLANETATLIFLDRVVADPDRSLSGQQWNISALLMGQLASTVAYGTAPWVDFATDGSFRAFTGCNTTTGAYIATETQLTFTEAVSTEMWCDVEGDGSDIMEIEHFIQGVFTETANYNIVATSLEIAHADGTGIWAVAAE